MRLALPLLLLIALNAGAQIIPAERTVTWQGNVGIPGGIPSGWPVFTNMTGLDTNGITDVTLALSNAVYNFPNTNGVCVFPAGKFNIGSSVTLYGHTILRGQGPTNTTFILGGSLNAANSGLPRSVVNWTNGFAKGASNVWLDDISGVSTGQVISLDELNNTNFVSATGSEGLYTGSGRTGTNPFNGSTRCYPQLVLVTAINGNQLTIDPPLYLDHSASLMPQALIWGTTTSQNNNGNWIGIEDCTINASNSASSWPINFTMASYVWVKNVECYLPGRADVLLEYAYRAEVFDSYFHDSRSVGATAYGVELLDSSACLVWNNRFANVVSAIVNGAAVGGCVQAYNFVTNNPTGFLFGSLFTHAVHDHMNLFEGNILPSIYEDCIHGSASHNTSFRNYLPGFAPGALSNLRPYSAEALNYTNNVIGNVMGTSGQQTFYQDTVLDPTGNFPIFYLGRSADTNNVPYDPRTEQSILRCGNWTTISNTVDSACGGTIPDSLFLNAQPSWWTNYGATPWPPIGSDLTPRVSKLPAQLRYEAGAPPTPTNTLVVASTNPGSGVSITVAPADNLGNSNGVTPLTRYYNTGTSVTLAAPPAAAGNGFSKWQTNGVDASASTIVIFALNANNTATAIYTNTPAPPSGRTIAIISGGAAIIGGSIIP